jgi:hypothetical protein
MSDISGNGGGTSETSGGKAAGSADGGRIWNVRTERLRVTSGELLSKLRELLHEGNVRRLVIRGHDDRVLIDIPVTAGAIGVVLAPFAVAIGILAAMATRCTIEIERIEVVPAEAAEPGTAEPEAAASSGEAEANAQPKPGTKKTRG